MTGENGSTDKSEASRVFERGLSQHGFPFEEAVLAQHHRCVREKRLRWRHLASEVPVRSGEKETRIDFLLVAEVQGEAHVLVAECKRVNPSYSSWCFARRSGPPDSLVARGFTRERLDKRSVPQKKLAAGGESDGLRDDSYDIAFVMKTEKKGDAHPISYDKDAIEVACSQVCLGLNGLVNLLERRDGLATLVPSAERLYLQPVVFTTADLKVSNADLAKTRVSDGVLELEGEVESRDRVYYQYAQSESVLHEQFRRPLEHRRFSRLLLRDYMRTIPIVTPAGIEEFLCAADPTRAGSP